MADKHRLRMLDIVAEALAEDKREGSRFDREGFSNFFLYDWQQDPEAVENAWYLYDQIKADE